MSSGSFASTLDLRLTRSYRAHRLLFLLHLAPLGLLLFAMQPGLPMLLLAAGFGLSWWWLRRHPVFGFGPRALERLVWQPASGWHIHDASGRHAAARLRADSYVHPRLIVLNFQMDNGRRRSRAILGDELPEEPLRRLRARLMSGPDEPGEDSQGPGHAG